MDISLDIQDDVALVTMDDGKKNAITIEAFQGLEAALDKAEADAAAVVLAGRPGSFCAGRNNTLASYHTHKGASIAPLSGFPANPRFSLILNRQRVDVVERGLIVVDVDATEDTPLPIGQLGGAASRPTAPSWRGEDAYS